MSPTPMPLVFPTPISSQRPDPKGGFTIIAHYFEAILQPAFAQVRVQVFSETHRIYIANITTSKHAPSAMNKWYPFCIIIAVIQLLALTRLSRGDTVSRIIPGFQSDGFVVEGRVALDAKLRGSGLKLVLNGGQRVTFPRADGSFSFSGVPPGTHLLEVVALGYLFPPVRLDVSARLRGQVKAVYAEDKRQVLSDPIVLTPSRLEEYFEKREPFSVWSLLKSPMGMMVAFMVVVVFVMPKLMDGIDPEEMKKMQEEMRNQPQPSLASLLGGKSK